MTTPDEGLAARLAELQATATNDDLHAETGGFISTNVGLMESTYGGDAAFSNQGDAALIAALWNAYRSGQLITLADHTRLMKEAVEAERDAILVEIGIMRGVETAGFVSARDDDDEASAISHGNALLALNDVCDAIRSRGVTV